MTNKKRAKLVALSVLDCMGFWEDDEDDREEVEMLIDDCYDKAEAARTSEAKERLTLLAKALERQLQIAD